MLITFTVRVTKQHPVNISFLKNQCSALQIHNRSCRFRIEIKYLQRPRDLIHTHPNLFLYFILSFNLRDNSVYFHECSPFRVGISTIGIQQKCLKLYFPLMLRTIIYFYVYIILDYPITYKNPSVICESGCACLHKTVNMVVFVVKSNEKNTYPKGRALMQMYRVELSI